MKLFHRAFPGSFGLVLLLGTLGCTQKLCCLKYPAETDQATYCNNHRDAVGKFIISAPDPSERQVRLKDFKAFYRKIEEACGTVQCIENSISSDAALSSFLGRYRGEHHFAERDTQIDEKMKTDLILCGFKHGLDGLENR